LTGYRHKETTVPVMVTVTDCGKYESNLFMVCVVRSNPLSIPI